MRTSFNQLDLIKAGKRRVAAAIRDYYRAFEQRSRWLRDELVVGLDLRRYEKRLIEEWDLVFEGMRDELGTADRSGQRRGRSLRSQMGGTGIRTHSPQRD
ncbi:ABC-three component system protein [Halomonas sp.]|uniref:ABC-three component system protein n=1 Tax=Halomonas sp. TaxID=1486246 RepID=UPI003A0FBB9C